MSKVSKKSSAVFEEPEVFYPGKLPEGLKNKETKNTKLEVLQGMTEVYSKYHSDFSTRKEKRLKSKNPLDSFPVFNLTIDNNYSKELQKKISEVMQRGLGVHLFHGLYKCTDTFVEALKEELKDLKGKRVLLQVQCLTEAWHTLMNAAHEAAKLAKKLFEFSDCSFETMHKNLFIEKIIKENQEMLETVKSQNPKHYVTSNLISMETQIKNDKPFESNAKALSLFEQGSKDNSQDEVVPLDDLVSYITQNKSKKKPKRKNKKKLAKSEVSTVGSSQSREVSPDLDREVEEFKQRLEKEVPVDLPLKPRLTPNFIQSLKTQLQALKSN